MTDYTLTLFEATGIQSYVFGSNELAQNIGASELVSRATTEWLAQSFKTLGLKSNGVAWDEKGGLTYDDQSILDGLDAEVVYAGGGNALLLFADSDQARAVVSFVTRKALREARGLQLVVGLETFDWAGPLSLAAVHRELIDKVAERKRNLHVSRPMPGLSVTAACDFTGQPAIGMDAYERRISAEVLCKQRASNMGKDRLKAALDGVLPSDLDLVYSFDDFGVKGESSYIAVIHADGNGMGQRFEELGRRHPSPKDNANYILGVRGLSRSIRDQATSALTSTVERLIKSLVFHNGRGYFGDVVPIPERTLGDGSRKAYLPFRPIVFGGDDATFVCDGRLGLDLAAAYLTAFTSGTLADGQSVFARAGVAVVKSHFPFSRAYELADGLASNAKKAIDQLHIDGEEGLTVLDWHFSTTGVILDLGEIRDREYQSVEGRSLLMRPVRLTDSTPATLRWRSWPNFTNLMAAFQHDQGNDYGVWSGRRNKLKALRDALRGGPEAVRLFLTNYQLKALPSVPGQPDMETNGWQGPECGYFDAVEALDFYVSLNDASEEHAT